MLHSPSSQPSRLPSPYQYLPGPRHGGLPRRTCPTDSQSQPAKICLGSCCSAIAPAQGSRTRDQNSPSLPSLCPPPVCAPCPNPGRPHPMPTVSANPVHQGEQIAGANGEKNSIPGRLLHALGEQRLVVGEDSALLLVALLRLGIEVGGVTGLSRHADIPVTSSQSSTHETQQPRLSSAPCDTPPSNLARRRLRPPFHRWTIPGTRRALQSPRQLQNNQLEMPWHQPCLTPSHTADRPPSQVRHVHVMRRRALAGRNVPHPRRTSRHISKAAHLSPAERRCTSEAAPHVAQLPPLAASPAPACCFLLSSSGFF